MKKYKGDPVIEANPCKACGQMAFSSSLPWDKWFKDRHGLNRQLLRADVQETDALRQEFEGHKSGDADDSGDSL